MNSIHTVAAVCHDQVVLAAVATQRDNWRNLWRAIENVDHPEDVPERLWRRALDTETIIATHTQAAITGCPCGNHTPTQGATESTHAPQKRAAYPSNAPTSLGAAKTVLAGHQHQHQHQQHRRKNVRRRPSFF